MITNKRQQRKNEHLKIALSIETGPKLTGFDDVELIHQALPDLNLADIDISTHFLNKKLAAPFLIEAITGGTTESLQINKQLALGAAKSGIAMAVGSQTAALDNPAVVRTFSIVREYNPNGLILANLAANVSVENALHAIEMIKADGLQLHLNIAQELMMEEGDRNFKGTSDSIQKIIQASPVPVIIKEVGFGVSRETAVKLHQLGAAIIDIGGAGGTNFAAIENKRRQNPLSTEWYNWGIPTVASIFECQDAQLPIQVIASGGIDSGIKAAKALALGAILVGGATVFLKSVTAEQNAVSLTNTIDSWSHDLKMAMLMTNAVNLKELNNKPVVIMGKTREWLINRKIALAKNTVI